VVRRARVRDARVPQSVVTALALAAALLLPGVPVSAAAPPDRLPGSLKTVPTPEPASLNRFLRTDSKGAVAPAARAAAIALGKALFWDQAVGSDGMACASCHFNAGADSRTRNALDPGLRAIPPDATFGTGFAPRYRLKGSDFPFTRFNVPDDRASGLVSDTNDIVSSEGVYHAAFVDITTDACPADAGPIGNICDRGTPQGDSIFGTARRVEPRNTPSVINAVFNFRNFWDGRARNEFNGVNPIGDLDPYARVLMASGSNFLQKVRLSGSLRLDDASLASQATGPTLSDMEMSFGGRTFPKLGKKLLGLPMALPGQMVAPDDSVLGPYSRPRQPGMNKTYSQLIRDAFQPQWWDSPLTIEVAAEQPDVDGTTRLIVSKQKAPLTTNQYSLAEYNFSLFWGIAIQMYEATLRADDTPFDQAFDFGNPLTFTGPTWGAAERQGWLVFSGPGLCLTCHGGPELTNASVGNVRSIALERMLMGDGGTAVYDEGFYNTAVRSCGSVSTGPCDDAGLGATIGPLGLPLATSRFHQLVGRGDPSVDPVCATDPVACIAPSVGGISAAPLDPFERVAADGAFKTPGLRNIELTAPYFHNGGDLSLTDVVDTYDRGSNFPDVNAANLDPDIGPLHLSDSETASLVAFMKALTDARVEFQRAPFDHPQLFVPDLGELPAVGRNGSAIPLTTFFGNLDPGQPPVPTISPLNQTVFSGTKVVLDASRTVDPNVPPLVPLTFTWLQTSGPVVALSLPPAPAPQDGSVKTFIAPTVAAGTATPLMFELKVTNTAGLTGAAVTEVRVTTDTVTITAATYRKTGILGVAATSSSPGCGAAVLKLTAALSDGTTFGPVTMGVDKITCAYTFQSGRSVFPAPTSATVTSSLGGSAESVVVSK